MAAPLRTYGPKLKMFVWDEGVLTCLRLFSIVISQSATNLHERAWTTFPETCFLFM
jgi:hypothetical protein